MQHLVEVVVEGIPIQEASNSPNFNDDSEDEDLSPPHSKQKTGSGNIQEDNEKKRQVRLMKNRQSAALSRQRKKEYISNLQKQVTRYTQESQQYQNQVSRLTTTNWESKVHTERLEKEIIKLVHENNELRSKLKDYGHQLDDYKPRTPADYGVGVQTASPITMDDVTNATPTQPQ